MADIEGKSIYGGLLDSHDDLVARAGTRAIAEENALLGENARLVTITTDQYLGGIVPFVDMASRYGDAAAILDSVELSIGARSYDVVSLQGGDPLKVGIKVEPPTADADPVELLRSTLEPVS